jgi:hypothetical protein
VAPLPDAAGFNTPCSILIQRFSIAGTIAMLGWLGLLVSLLKTAMDR